MSEQNIQRNIQNKLKSLGCWFVKVITCNKSGTPDIIACVPVEITQDMVGQTYGLFMGIEVKQPGKHPSKLQTYQIRKIHEAGGMAQVSYGPHDLKLHLY